MNKPGRPKGKKSSYTMSEEALMVRRMAKLTNGSRSKLFQEYLKSRGFDVVSKTIDGMRDELQNSLELMQKRDEVHDLLFNAYKQTGLRGLELQDQLLELDMMLLSKREELRQKGKNPIDDRNYMAAVKLKIELRKELDRLNFDKGKFVVENKEALNEMNEEGQVFDEDLFKDVK